jgi:N-acetyltransferase
LLILQKDFNASRCAVCGMMYAKGHEEDEKLHKAFHQAAVQGPRFQVWWDNVCNLTSDPPAESTMPDDAVVCTNAAPLRLAIIHNQLLLCNCFAGLVPRAGAAV